MLKEKNIGLKQNRKITQVVLYIVVWLLLFCFPLPKEQVIFNVDYNHSQYNVLGDGFNQQFSLLNASICYRFLKDNNADIRMTVYDLLNQNTNISRTVTETYINDTQTRVLTRYLMLTFTYNLRKFGLSQSLPEQEESRSWGGRPGGFY